MSSTAPRSPRLPSARFVLTGVTALGAAMLVVQLKIQRDSLEEQIAKEEQIGERLRTSIADARAALNAGVSDDLLARRSDFLPGSTDSRIGAALRQRLTDSAARHGVEIARTQTLPPLTREDAALPLLKLRLELRAPLQSVHAFLYEIETTSPYLFVERAQMRMEMPSRPGARPPGPRARLIAEIDISGAKWTGAPSGSAGANADVTEP